MSDKRKAKEVRRAKRQAKKHVPVNGTAPKERSTTKKQPPQKPVVNLKPDPEGVKDCGGCTMCCDVLGIGIAEGELKLSARTTEGHKPPNSACQFCTESGCSVYEDEKRPSACKQFECWWLQSQGMNMKMPLEERPDKLGAVIVSSEQSVTFNVPSDKMGVWRSEFSRMSKLIGRLDRAGLAVFVSCGDYRAAVSKSAVLMVEKNSQA